jgi:hypothetical protein
LIDVAWFACRLKREESFLTLDLLAVEMSLKMIEPFLLSRLLLQFGDASSNLLAEMSAVTFTPDGSLWVGSDELTTIERLFPVDHHVFGEHESVAIANFIELFDQDSEIDIEGLDYNEPYLWFTGSHSTKRKKTKGKNLEKDIRKLSEIKTELNRYIIARIPFSEKKLHKSCPHPTHPKKTCTAACLKKTDEGNILTEALKTDSHLGPFLSNCIPSKENGFDIEGLAVYNSTIFLGLRGPVLREWAIILEIEVEETEPGILTLKETGEDEQLYKKHFVDLKGLGIRELCFHGKDLLILAGPTMSIEGAMRVYRLKHALEHPSDSLSSQDTGDLEVVFDLPFTLETDHAEGLALFPCFDQTNGLLVVYDSPDPVRKAASDAIFADIFRLK